MVECGAGIPCSQSIPPNFFLPHVGVGLPIPCLCVSVSLPLLPIFPPFSSCPWVIQIGSLASTFPTLFLTSLCLFCTYQLYFLFPVPFPPFSSLPYPTDNLPCDLHFCDSVPVLLVCLVCFWVFLGSVVNSCEFGIILVFIFLIFFFFNKSLQHFI